MIPQDSKLLGSSDAFLDTLDKLSQLAPINRPLLIVGERGTGKEIIAERVHYLSPRWDKPLIKTNCAAIAPTLLESELFGHEAGSFTGASKRHAGRFERAQHGTLFLDELATLSSAAQEKLLRVIEYGQFERVGGTAPIAVDVRIVAATNIDLPTAAAQGEFRHDLLDRLAFDVLTLPPLRERQEDILPLAQHFALRMCKELNRGFFPGFSPAAEQQLLNHSWPGNIRELKNVVERALCHSPDGEEIKRITLDPFDSPYRLNQSFAPPKQPSRKTEKPTNKDAIPLPVNWTEKKAQIEAEVVRSALQGARHNQKNAAELLNLSYHQFRNLLKKYNIQDPDETND